jgi:hypothetical protein
MKSQASLEDGPCDAKLSVGPIPTKPMAEGFTIQKDGSDVFVTR